MSPLPPPADSPAAMAPDVGMSAAPGVAFNYHYAFRLPNAKIAAVQEQHAMACEKLGLDRCRIVGMRYRLVENDDVSAMLAFKLDPAIAREFGKQGIASVTAAEGMLIDSEITGTDAGATIADADRRTARLRENLARIETQLSALKPTSSDRVELQQQADALRQQLRGTADIKTEARESLATTPVVFDYGAGNLVRGFGGQSPLRDAFGTAVGSFLTMLSFIIIAFGALLPWALLGGFGFLIVRSVHRRLPRVTRKDDTIPIA